MNFELGFLLYDIIISNFFIFLDIASAATSVSCDIFWTVRYIKTKNKPFYSFCK